MYLILTHIFRLKVSVGDSGLCFCVCETFIERRGFRSLLLCLCDVYRALIISLVLILHERSGPRFHLD